MEYPQILPFPLFIVFICIFHLPIMPWGFRRLAVLSQVPG